MPICFLLLALSLMNPDLTLPIGLLPVIVASFDSQDLQWSRHTLSLFCMHSGLVTPFLFLYAHLSAFLELNTVP